jgi:hypothetical protein
MAASSLPLVLPLRTTVTASIAIQVAHEEDDKNVLFQATTVGDYRATMSVGREQCLRSLTTDQRTATAIAGNADPISWKSDSATQVMFYPSNLRQSPPFLIWNTALAL